ncbi:MAG TPA: cytochrome C, partial [Candidatus Binatia bacterium]
MNRVLTAFLAGAFLFMIDPITARGQKLPEGEGSQLVQNLCTSCHETNLITRSSGYSREGWQELIQSMVNLSGSPAGETISQYLATHFPPGTH